MRPELRRAHWGRWALHSWGVLVLAFLYLPLVIVVAYSFNASEYVAVWGGFTTHWYHVAFSDPANMSAIRTSAWVAADAAVLSTLAGVPAGLALATWRGPGRGPLEVGLYLAIAIPEIVLGVGLLLTLTRWGHYIGIADMGRAVGSFPFGFAPVTIVLGHMVFTLPVVTLIVAARAATMGADLEEAAFDLGAGPWITFARVTFPRLLPAVVAGLLLAFTLSFDDVVLSFFMSGASATTWPLRILGSLRFGLTPELNAVATAMLAVTVTIVTVAGLVATRLLPGPGE
jgi:spermidine/putrescine transport system permease protein